MGNYHPNEQSCPVPLDLLAQLRRCDEKRLSANIHKLPEPQRFALAQYCFSRYHMRRLALALAPRRPEAGGGRPGD